MICVTISSFFGIIRGSLFTFTGMSRVLAAVRSTMVRVRPSRMAAKPFLFRTELRKSTASSWLMGLALMTLTVPFTGASKTMIKPAASLRYSRTCSSGAFLKFI